MGCHNKTANYCSKFLHHLSQTYGENKHFGAAYLTAGAGILMSNGLITIFSDNPESTNDDAVTRIGWGMVGTGGFLMASPFFNAMRLASRDEP